ncbi:hypothetical protein ACWGN5_16720 [Streptomyces sp. NPDC055815]
MESEVERRPRAATWWSRPVLAAVLLVGLVLMHVLGHPGERTAAAHASGGSVSAAAEEHLGAHADDASPRAGAHGSQVTQRAGAHAFPAEQRPGAHAFHATQRAGSHPGRAESPAPVHGVGVAAVCLAVLGAGVGLLLSVRRALVRRRREAGTPSAGRIAHALWAIPPPASPGSLLTRLSLLRI